MLVRLLGVFIIRLFRNHPAGPPPVAAARLSEADLNMWRYGVPVVELLDPAAPATNLSGPRMRELATGGLLLMGWGLPLKQLVPVLPKKKEIIWTMLKRDWGVETVEELREAMQRLLDEGHRATLQPELAQNEAYWRAKFDEHDFLRAIPIRSVAGWDAGRIVCLAYWGLLIDMLDRDTAFGYMAQATALAQQHLGSWREMAGSYLGGYVMWNPEGKDRMKEYSVSARTLLEAEQGLWRLLPWAGPQPTPPPMPPAVAAQALAPPAEKIPAYDYLKTYGVLSLNSCVENSGREIILSPFACRAVATGAILVYNWSLPLKRLVPLQPAHLARLHEALAIGWDITSGEEACQRMDDLYEVGHRAELQPRFVQNEAYWRAEFDKFPFLRDRPVSSVAAWDYGRVASVAYLSLAAGFLDKDTAFRYMDKATRVSMERFHSWEEFAVSYLAGRCMWNPDEPKVLETMIDHVEEVLLKFTVSAWGSSPWGEYTPWPWKK